MGVPNFSFLFAQRVRHKQRNRYKNRYGSIYENFHGLRVSKLRVSILILFTSFGEYFFVSVMQCGSIDHHISMCPLIRREKLSQYIPKDVLGQYFPLDYPTLRHHYKVNQHFRTPSPTCASPYHTPHYTPLLPKNVSKYPIK